MKFELKHIAPYLPYRLKVLYQDGTIHEMIGVKLFEIQKVSKEGNPSNCGINTIKPILRPLSDLTKEIEHNGEKFVPNHDSDFKYFITHELDYFIESIPSSLNYNQMQKLLEWHFDVFNLIKHNLAIDINQL